MRLHLFILCMVACVAGSASAQEVITGRATIIDGDTIEIRGERIRLNGIDAPEGRQLCQNAKGKAYRCGAVAARAKGARIYHLVGQRDYDKTRITESRGERWFCSEDEAQAAGWKPAKGKPEPADKEPGHL